ncbi:MAG: hypothetical protein KC561_13700, partial [Myxococcales bacterium]|nr:hypothetical protein [Myxococcales bacterium]
MPRLKVLFKDESRLQRLIGRVLSPFNPRYMSEYTTVMWGRIYFPSRKWYAQRDPRSLYVLLRHEAVHLQDARRFPLLFEMSYLFALPAVLTVRSIWELRAYRATIEALVELDGAVSSDVLE